MLGYKTDVVSAYQVMAFPCQFIFWLCHRGIFIGHVPTYQVICYFSEFSDQYCCRTIIDYKNTDNFGILFLYILN